MKLPDALRDIQRLGFDTAPIIYFVEKNPKYFEHMMFIMRKIHEGSLEGVGSALLLTEVLVYPLQTDNNNLAERYERILTKSLYFWVEPLQLTTARLAAELRARHNIHTPDALHIASAIDAGCNAFLTNDTGLKRVSEITILILDELELE